MRNAWITIVLIGFMTACSDRQKTAESTEEMLADSLAVADSLAAVADSIAAEAMPIGADELFDDFFVNYASNKQQQRKRTVFPLPVVEGEQRRMVQQKEWKMEPFFMKDGLYTLFFESSDQINWITDTTLMVATVERFWLEQDKVEQFVFSREGGSWMLHEIRHQTLAQNPNGQFLKFYERFATDSVFQHQSLASQIQFSGPDPEDDFSTIDGVITPEFWDAFRPTLPHHKLYNIVYGRQNPAAIQKIMLLRDVSSDMEMELTFKLRKGRWKLTKLTT